MKNRLQEVGKSGVANSHGIARSGNVSPQSADTADSSTDMGFAAGRRHQDSANQQAASHVIRFIANAWPQLPPHVKEAILTMIDASIRSAEGSGRL